jgi:hypothetical protein
MNLTFALVFLGLAFVGFIYTLFRLRRQQPECVEFSLGEVVTRVVLPAGLITTVAWL